MVLSKGMARTIEISDENEEEFEEIIESVGMNSRSVEENLIGLLSLGQKRMEEYRPPDRHIDSLLALETVLWLRHGIDDVDRDALLYASTVVALSAPDVVADELQENPTW